MDVFCEICRKRWDQRDPGVTWLNVDRAWTCTDETLCFDRRAMQQLDQEAGR